MDNTNKSSIRYPVPQANWDSPYITELVIRKSRFLTQVCHCSSSASCREFINTIRGKYPTASHNCWAYVAGPPGFGGATGYSDDGEPHGTAGKPMLTVLQNSGIGEICAVVTRWFGGIKLGTGGLARAYQTSVKENLAALPLKELVHTQILEVTLPYALIKSFQKIAINHEAEIQSENYAEKVTFCVRIPEDHIGEFKDEILKWDPKRILLKN